MGLSARGTGHGPGTSRGRIVSADGAPRHRAAARAMAAASSPLRTAAVLAAGMSTRERACGPAVEVIFDFQGELDAQAQATGGGPEDTGTGNATGPMTAATVWPATLRSPGGREGRSPPPGGLGGRPTTKLGAYTRPP